MTSTAATTPMSRLTRHVVELACRAPSVHNTQPWWWRVHHNVLELHADPTRRLVATDPQGRTMIISCGAALHQAEVAARALGVPADIRRLPEGPPPGPLAQLELHRTAPPPTAEQDLRALVERRTDRRRFTSWPVPAARLESLAEETLPHDVRASVLSDVTTRFRIDLLLSRAHTVQGRDHRIREELASWQDHGDDVGLVGSDALVVLSTDEDDVAAWLRAGEALAALWLAAHAEGLSVVPLSQPLEVAETREALRHEIGGPSAGGIPQLLLRIGWRPLSRPELPPTPRRPLAEVLRP